MTRTRARAQRLGWCALLPLLGAATCHPGMMFFPPDLPTDGSLVLASSHTGFPRAAVDVLVDNQGISHIWARSENDLAYAQGFVHARDRLWQIVSQRAYALGRLSEILGESALDWDRANRLFTIGLDDQLRGLNDRDRSLLDAYAAGINDGAAHAGPSVEMVALGVVFEPYRARDALALARLQAWNLSTGLSEELARVALQKRLPEGDARLTALLAPVGTEGVPVVATRTKRSEAAPPRAIPSAATMTTRAAATDAKKARPALPPLFANLAPWLSRGASNVWVVHGSKTRDGFPILSHDPHLAHSGPGLFHLAHLEAPGFVAAGGGIPGLPGVLIGHGRHVAWGIPVSNADTQDLVEIEVVPPEPESDDVERYLLDGEAVPFGVVTQTYYVGAGPKRRTVTESWRTTVFGPVVPKGADPLLAEDAVYALQWPALRPLTEEGALISAFWDLAKATNIDEAELAINRLTSPPQSFGLAFTDGTIGYRLGGDIPLRQGNEPVAFPRDGKKRTAGFNGRLDSADKPKLTNPSSGFVVAANQRIVSDDHPRVATIGTEGATPYRAARIVERMKALVDRGDVTVEEVLDVQRDIVHHKARRLAPVLGAACDPARLDAIYRTRAEILCAALKAFDGAFELTSQPAVVYRRVEDRLRHAIVARAVGEDVAADLMLVSFVEHAVHEAILATAAGKPSPLLDDRDTDGYDGLGPFLDAALVAVLERADADGQADPASWQWGAMHQIVFEGSLGRALKSVPVVSGLFSTAPLPDPGCRGCVRAESGPAFTGRVTHGAVLRVIAVMSDPPVVRVVATTGQSGHFGHPHFSDQTPAWLAVEPILLVRTRDEVEAELEGRVTLAPHPARSARK